ncbi:uncharacterized protein Dvar_65260 [Desulfosarcina variabilis str. Montpellier]
MQARRNLVKIMRNAVCPLPRFAKVHDNRQVLEHTGHLHRLIAERLRRRNDNQAHDRKFQISNLKFEI